MGHPVVASKLKTLNVIMITNKDHRNFLKKSHTSVLPVLSPELPDELVDGGHQSRVAILDVDINAHVGEGPVNA